MVLCVKILAYVVLFFQFGLTTPRVIASELVPTELKDVSLGITLDQLQSKRPGIQRLDLVSRIQYFETGLKSVFFDRVDFIFDENELVEIALSKSVETLDFIKAHRSNLLKKSLLNFGENYKLFVNVLMGFNDIRHYMPVIVWEKKENIFAISYTPSCDLHGKEFNSSNDPIARFALYYFDMVIMENHLDIKKELSALDLLPASDLEGSNCLFACLENTKKELSLD